MNLRKNHDNRPSKKIIFALSIGLQLSLLVLMWVAEPLRKSSMSFDPAEAEQRAQANEAANKKRIEEETERRKKTNITKEDAERLKNEEDNKRKKKVADKLIEMREIRENIEKVAEVALAILDEAKDSSNYEASLAAPIEEMSLNEVLTEVNDLEQAITKQFSELRGAEMAQLENITFAEAMKNLIQSGASQPPAGVTPLNGVAPQAESSTIAEADAQGMGKEAGAPASVSTSPFGTVAQLNAYRETMDAALAMANQAWGRAQNMAQQAGANASKQEIARASALSSNRSANSSGSLDASGAQGTATSYGDYSKQGNRSDAGSGRGLGSARGGGSQGQSLKVSSSQVTAKALPGRKFNKSSNRQGWLFLDTWYIIGPWENNSQINYKNTHPPELCVDLDGEYLDGKLDQNTHLAKKLKWQFTQSDKMRITPPDENGGSTYYCFTEVFFEEATEMLIAIASDDAARMWINDQLVWEDTGLSPWRLDEGFRKVLFKKGFNKVLVRLENGPVVCQFSVVICPPDQISGNGG